MSGIKNKAYDVEQQVLQQTVEKMGQEGKNIFLRAWFNPLFWFLCIALAYEVLSMHSNGNVSTSLLVLISGLIGGAVVYVSMYQEGESMWPLIKPHLNRESIKRRLKELDK